ARGLGGCPGRTRSGIRPACASGASRGRVSGRLRGINMDSQRLILFFVFAFSVFLLLDGWQRDRQPAQPPVAVEKGEKAATASPTPTPGEKLAATQAAVPKDAAAAPREPGKTVRVETDLVTAYISTAGGDLQRLELKQHRDTVDKNKPF